MDPTYRATDGSTYVRRALVVAYTTPVDSGRELLLGDVVISRDCDRVRPGVRVLVDDTKRGGWVCLVDQVWSGGCWDDVPGSSRNVRTTRIGSVRRASTHDPDIPDFLSPRWDPEP